MLLPPALTKQSFYQKISVASCVEFAKPRKNQEAHTDSSLGDAIHLVFGLVLWLRGQELSQVPGTMDLRRGHLHRDPPPSSWACCTNHRGHRCGMDSLCFPVLTCRWCPWDLTMVVIS